MNTLTVSAFRNQLAASFDRADAGEKVYIRRNNRLYTITPVSDESSVITPELQAKIDKARAEYRAGKTLTFSSAAEAQRWMDEL